MTDSDQPQRTVTEADTGKSGGDSPENSVPLEIAVEEIGAGRKRLKIEIPAERIAAKLDNSYSQLNSDAMIPGFRRGRAPRRLIERRFSSAVREDTCSELVSESFTEAVETQELRVVGEPDIKDQDSLTLPEDGGLAFEVEVEVIPPIDLPELEGIAIKRYKFDVADDDVETSINRFRARYGSFSDVSAGAVEAGDWMHADVRVLAGHDVSPEAEPIAHVADTPILVPTDDTDGQGHVVGLAIDDFRSLVVGKTVGETLTISMTGPPSHENEQIKDQPITVAAHINKVERNEPCTLEVLVEQFGIESEEKLRNHLRESLEEQAERNRVSNMRDQISEHLLEAVSLGLPEGLTGRQTERMLQRRALHLASRGMSEEEVEQAVAKSRSDSQRDATRHLKLFFILNEASEKLNVEVSAAEVNGQVAAMAQDRGRRPEKLRQEMQRGGELEHLYILLRDTKTLNALVEKAKVSDVDEPPPTDDAS